ncbi:valine dehydrogenase [Glycomyces sp. TRM65418]|uniref:Glu/Leu/Phe/Val dehydrogenase dimerization domain-containing protein n=1 Tax=Glycomyces sp. TRM65418 TaxID=2867006 RepID=UPI001CE561D6|nr:Glu/Leu/Phe/Val dehydrogenase dimerization domain-containing protein [Glycomyces sp. TRM65418]MCC3764719.1 valine dehydrogenase [Glycomyces sp. TRM65418]QZD54377.1 valine dehydrogenase [Glycomyces sp. TRM65418]
MSIFDGSGHEQVVFCHDPDSGLRAIIAIYSTALGPALGGTRFYPYASEEEALTDVLHLSEGMAYKNAIAGLDHGGGKAVIWGDPNVDKSEPLLRAYGRFVDSLGGRYVTACDVGTYVEDMDHVARETRHVSGRSPEAGGAGDSSILTAFGVFQAMRAAAQHRWGAVDLTGRTVGVAGLGKVGRHLVPHLLEAGAEVVACDVDPAAVGWAAGNFPQVRIVEGTDELIAAGIHVYAPCAMGGVLNDQSLKALDAEIICGAANNQLAEPHIADELERAGILYCPDYVVNSGGVIQVADEYDGAFDFKRAERRTAGIFATTARILERAKGEGITPLAAADAIAEERIAAVGRLQRVRLFR